MSDYISSYTGAEIDSILNNAIELPNIPTNTKDYNTFNNNGLGYGYKVLGVNSSKLRAEWTDLSELFPSQGEPGNILGLDSNGELEWKNYSITPSTTDFDSGKFLKYDGSNLIWDTPDLPSLTDIVGLHGESYNGHSLMYDSNQDGYYLGDPLNLESAATNGAVLKCVVSENSTGNYTIWGSPFPENGISEGAVLRVHENGEVYWDDSLNN